MLFLLKGVRVSFDSGNRNKKNLNRDIYNYNLFFDQIPVYRSLVPLNVKIDQFF